MKMKVFSDRKVVREEVLVIVANICSIGSSYRLLFEQQPECHASRSEPFKHFNSLKCQPFSCLPALTVSPSSWNILPNQKPFFAQPTPFPLGHHSVPNPYPLESRLSYPGFCTSLHAPHMPFACRSGSTYHMGFSLFIFKKAMSFLKDDFLGPLIGSACL